MEYKLTIKELPEGERPRERLVELGPASLSNAELLAILLRTGSDEGSALDLAYKLLRLGGDVEARTNSTGAPSRFDGGYAGGLRYLAEADISELTKVRGVGLAKAAQIKAAIELGRRIALENVCRPYIRSAAEAAAIIMERLRYEDREHFEVLILGTRNQLLGVGQVSVGSLNSSLVHPREVFKLAVRKSAAAVILAHNHPSGDPSPSSEDIVITRRLIEAGQILGIDVLDHIIVGQNKFVSMREKKLVF